MQVDQLRKQLTTMKIHIDQLEDWLKQATDMVYEIEEKIMDIEDQRLYSKKNNYAGAEFLTEAVLGIY